MATKGPKFFQTLRQGLGKLLGITPEQSKVAEIGIKTPVHKPSRDIAPTSGHQTSVQNHDPFNLPLDHGIPERPFIPPLEITRDHNAHEAAKDIHKAPNVSTTLPKNNTAAAEPQTSIHRNGPSKLPLDHGVPERPFIPPLSITQDRDTHEAAKDIHRAPDIGTTLPNIKHNIKIDRDIPERPIIEPKVTGNDGAKNVTAKEMDGAQDIGISTQNTKNEKNMKDKATSDNVTKVAINDSGRLRGQPLTFEAMTPIRQVIKAHTPLIRFRKGLAHIEPNVIGLSSQLLGNPGDADADQLKSDLLMSSIAANKGQWKSSPILHEWWDTPYRFKRRVVDDQECDIINGGGCDKLYQ